MSVNDIMNYVSQTPGNTNPSVIRSMVETEVENGQKDVVKYTPQSLTEEQKAQARANIGSDYVIIDLDTHMAWKQMEVEPQ